MGVLTFLGGVHPYDGKELSKSKPIFRVVPKGELVYPLSQHIGASATPLVAKGDTILKGQKIAEAAGFVSVPVHASASGVVKGIEPRLTATGAMINSIILDNDQEYKEVEYEEVKPYTSLSKEEIRKKIQAAGIVGMGGAGFPTHVKLSPKDESAIDTIIVNCAECEPYLTSDYRRMLEEPEKLVGGLKVILHLFERASGILAIEDNKPDCIEKLQEMVKEESNITVKALKTKYPQGAERQLIFASTGRSINSSMLPADAGCIVNNVDTVIAIHQAFSIGQPLMERLVTVTGDAIVNPGNFLAPVGMNYEELIEAAGGFKTEPVKMISGGPMMGFALFQTNVPVTKSSSAFLALSKDDVAKLKPSACINCGRCVEVCPGRIIPAKLADLAERNDAENFVKLDGMECCACGCCSYICPAKRMLSQSIKSMRANVLASRKK